MFLQYINRPLDIPHPFPHRGPSDQKSRHGGILAVGPFFRPAALSKIPLLHRQGTITFPHRADGKILVLSDSGSFLPRIRML